MKKIVTVSILALAALSLTGCGTTTGERAGSAALMGAAGGALIGSLSAPARACALIRACVGAFLSYLYYHHQKRNIYSSSLPYSAQVRIRVSSLLPAPLVSPCSLDPVAGGGASGGFRSGCHGLPFQVLHPQ